MKERAARRWILDLVALGSTVAVAALTVALCSGCTPLQYVRSHPVVAPEPLPIVPLTTAVMQPDDCGAFTFEDGSWREEPWLQSGAVLDTVEPGDVPPAVDLKMRASCRYLVIPAPIWTVAREARVRFGPMSQQLQLWNGYAERQAARQQAESEALAELLVRARRRQVLSFLVGAGAGGAVVAALVISLALAGR